MTILASINDGPLFVVSNGEVCTGTVSSNAVVVGRAVYHFSKPNEPAPGGTYSFPTEWKQSWIFQEQIQSNILSNDSTFGTSIGSVGEINGDSYYDTVVIGAPGLDSSTVRYTYEVDQLEGRANITKDYPFWEHTLGSADGLGSAIAVSINNLGAIIGANLATVSGVIEAGSAQIWWEDQTSPNGWYENSHVLWYPSAIITAPDPIPGAHFGSSVATNANHTVAVIGAPDWDPGLSGNPLGNAYVATMVNGQII
jgi:hypothetical protein